MFTPNTNGIMLLLILVVGIIIIFKLTVGNKLFRKKSKIEEYYDLKTAMFDNALNAFIVTNLDGVVMLWNGTCEKMFGFKASEAISKNIHDLIIPDQYKQMHITGMKKYKETGQSKLVDNPEGVPVDAISKYGKTVPIRLFLKRIEISPNVYLAGFIVDKTHVRKTIEELTEKVRLFETGEQLIKTGFWYWDMPKDNVVYSKNFAEIFEIDEGKDVKAAELMEIVYIEDRKKVNDAMLNSLNTGTGYEIEYRVLRRNGVKEMIHCIGETRLNENGKTVAIYGSVSVKTCKDECRTIS